MNIWGTEEEYLSPTEKNLRDLYVKEYLVDYDPHLACMRIGFNNSVAREKSVTFMQEPYVQRKIKELKYTKSEDEEDEEERDRLLVLSTLRQASQSGPFPSRVAAASKLATILGMDKPIPNQLEITHKGGVMKVPGAVSLETWEAEAVAAQEQLIRDAQE